MKRFLLIACFSYALIWNGFAQETFPINDVQDRRGEAYAFTNANLYVDYQTKISNATLLIKEGKVVKSGAGLNVPKGYTVIDLKGKYIYPSFIDLYSNYGLPTVKPPALVGMRPNRSNLPRRELTTPIRPSNLSFVRLRFLKLIRPKLKVIAT